MNSKEALEELLYYANLNFERENERKTEFANKVEQMGISDNKENFKIIKKDLDRLEQLEDIEEELEIDLATLFTALEKGVWYKDYKDDDKIKFTDRVEENIKCKEFIVPAKYTIIGLKFRDYGKTFALTKEELEND